MRPAERSKFWGPGVTHPGRACTGAERRFVSLSCPGALARFDFGRFFCWAPFLRTFEAKRDDEGCARFPLEILTILGHVRSRARIATVSCVAQLVESVIR